MTRASIRTPDAAGRPMSDGGAPAGRAAGRVLVVDDDPAILQIIRRYLEREGHTVCTAETIAAALDALSEHAFEVALVDLRLPGGSGIDVLTSVRSQAPHTRLIMVTGSPDLPAASAAVEQRIDALVLKPFDLELLGTRVCEAVTRFRAAHAERHERVLLEARLRQRETESRIWVLRAAHALAHAVEAKDPYTAGHAQRVTGYALRIAEKAGGIDLLRFRLAGDLHDVGKIGVPDAVLNKPGRLDAAEIELIRRHPGVGRGILEPFIDDPLVLGVVQWHHERWDGGGYPDGLRGAEIPLLARILAVADTLDAMTSQRSYRSALPWDATVAEIRRNSGTQFDPEVVDLFDQVLPELEAKHAGFLAAAKP